MDGDNVMTHELVLSLFVITGVFTPEEFKLFLKETEDKVVPENATWEYFVSEVEEWKKNRK